MKIDYCEKIAYQIDQRYGKTFKYPSALIGVMILQMLNHDEPITYETLLKKLQDGEIDNILNEERN